MLRLSPLLACKVPWLVKVLGLTLIVPPVPPPLSSALIVPWLKGLPPFKRPLLPRTVIPGPIVSVVPSV